MLKTPGDFPWPDLGSSIKEIIERRSTQPPNAVGKKSQALFERVLNLRDGSVRLPARAGTWPVFLSMPRPRPRGPDLPHGCWGCGSHRERGSGAAARSSNLAINQTISPQFPASRRISDREETRPCWEGRAALPSTTGHVSPSVSLVQLGLAKLLF